MTVPRRAAEIEPGSILASRHAAEKKTCLSPRRFALRRIVNDLPRREGRVAKLCDSL